MLLLSGFYLLDSSIWVHQRFVYSFMPSVEEMSTRLLFLKTRHFALICTSSGSF